MTGPDGRGAPALVRADLITVLLAAITFASGCLSDHGLRRHALPASRLGPIAATIDTVMQGHPDASCHDYSYITQDGPTQPAVGCFLKSHDTLVFFYVSPHDTMLAWGREWLVPDSARLRAIADLRRHLDGFLGAGRVCSPVERLQGLTTWQAPGYFLYSFSDSLASALQTSHNTFEGARLGIADCDPRDIVTAPLLR